MRNRLIELLRKADDATEILTGDFPSYEEELQAFYSSIADYLLDNGVIVLPCAVGDTVYVVTACENVVMNHDTDYFTGTGAIECPYENDCPCEDCGDENKRVFETYCSNIYFDEDGFNIILENFALTATLEDFGKTVFLIKEEAEAKLAELKGE